MMSDMFIQKLNKILPDEFQAKKFNGMPRIHIKYHHYGFAVIDLRKDYYHLYALEGMFSAIGVQHFDHMSDTGNKKNRIKHIPYEDTVVLQKLIKFVQDNPSEVVNNTVQLY